MKKYSTGRNYIRAPLIITPVNGKEDKTKQKLNSLLTLLKSKKDIKRDKPKDNKTLGCRFKKLRIHTEKNEDFNKLNSNSTKSSKKIFFGLKPDKKEKKALENDHFRQKSIKRIKSGTSLDRIFIKDKSKNFTSFFKKLSPKARKLLPIKKLLPCSSSVDKAGSSTILQSFVSKIQKNKESNNDHSSPSTRQPYLSMLGDRKSKFIYQEKLRKIVSGGKPSDSMMKRPKSKIKVVITRIKTTVEDSKHAKVKLPSIGSDKTNKPLKSMSSFRGKEFLKNLKNLQSEAKTEKLQKEKKRISAIKNLCETLRSEDQNIKNYNHEGYQMVYSKKGLENLILSESISSPSGNLLKKHDELKWEMRAILVDWITEVCTEYSFKRETFYLAINFLDRYLDSTTGIKKCKLQLIGGTVLFVAAKLEEVYTPKLESIIVAASGLYTVDEFLNSEIELVKHLGYFLSSPTICSWTNWFLLQWDAFCDENKYSKNSIQLITFRHPSENSYLSYRKLFSLFDCMILDIRTLLYKPRAIIASALYLLIGLEAKEFNKKDIVLKFPVTSDYLTETHTEYNDYFGRFTIKCFGFILNDLLPTIQFVSAFFELSPSLKPPPILELEKEKILEGHFEEFLSYQTHAPETLQFILHQINQGTL